MRDLLIPLAVLVLAACGPATTAPAAKTTLASLKSGEHTAELLTDTRLEVGLTPVYLKLTDAAGAALVDAEVKLIPVMTMLTNSHSAPVLGDAVLGEQGLYRSEVVFSMPSGEMGTWSLKASVQRPNAAPLVLEFKDLPVAESGRVKTFTAPSAADPAVSEKFVMSLNFVTAPKVGLNPVVVTLHQMKDMITFVPFEQAQLQMVPEMPAMGHGSSGNVAPTPTTAGRYEGKLSFSMGGDWLTTFTIRRSGGTTMSTVAFDTTL